MGRMPKLLLCSLVALLASPLRAQLAPRAYVITPVGFNAVMLTWGYINGGVNLAEDSNRHESHGHRADGSVRSHEAGELGN